jgi:hypothetical protein
MSRVENQPSKKLGGSRYLAVHIRTTRRYIPEDGNIENKVSIYIKS